jgi:hypothetical protein
VSSESIVPRFVNFDQMPKHWKFSFPADFEFGNSQQAVDGQATSPIVARPVELVRAHDIVEVSGGTSISRYATRWHRWTDLLRARMVSDQVSSTHEEMRTEAFEREMAHLSEKEVLLRRIVKRKSANVGAPLDRTHQATQDSPEAANGTSSSLSCVGCCVLCGVSH